LPTPGKINVKNITGGSRGKKVFVRELNDGKRNRKKTRNYDRSIHGVTWADRNGKSQKIGRAKEDSLSTGKREGEVGGASKRDGKNGTRTKAQKKKKKNDWPLHNGTNPI